MRPYLVERTVARFANGVVSTAAPRVRAYRLILSSRSPGKAGEDGCDSQRIIDRNTA